jgi:hypothetical protein
VTGGCRIQICAVLGLDRTDGMLATSGMVIFVLNYVELTNVEFWMKLHR